MLYNKVRSFHLLIIRYSSLSHRLEESALSHRLVYMFTTVYCGNINKSATTYQFHFHICFITCYLGVAPDNSDTSCV